MPVGIGASMVASNLSPRIVYSQDNQGFYTLRRTLGLASVPQGHLPIFWQSYLHLQFKTRH